MSMQETVLTRAFFENRHDLMAFLKAKLQCTATADDLCQDIYLKLHRVDDPCAIENCRSYLFMVAANLVADTLRKEGRRSSLLSEGHDVAWPVMENPTPEDIFVGRAEIAWLNRAVAELPALSRKIFYANRFENKTQRDIAAQFEVSISTVEYHIRKVLDHLARARDEFHRQL
jgi:RNA polymerase sigma factor (sigma-70 family)